MFLHVYIASDRWSRAPSRRRRRTWSVTSAGWPASTRWRWPPTRWRRFVAPWRPLPLAVFTTWPSSEVERKSSRVFKPFVVIFLLPRVFQTVNYVKFPASNCLRSQFKITKLYFDVLICVKLSLIWRPNYVFFLSSQVLHKFCRWFHILEDSYRRKAFSFRQR